MSAPTNNGIQADSMGVRERLDAWTREMMEWHFNPDTGSPEPRRKFFITGPQWALAYYGFALFNPSTRGAVPCEEVVKQYAGRGPAQWIATHPDPAEVVTSRKDVLVSPRFGKCSTTRQAHGFGTGKVVITSRNAGHRTLMHQLTFNRRV